MSENDESKNEESNHNPSSDHEPGEEWIDREHFLHFLQSCWREARQDYRAAGAPFGSSRRGLQLWVKYEQRTTCN